MKIRVSYVGDELPDLLKILGVNESAAKLQPAKGKYKRAYIEYNVPKSTENRGFEA